MWLFVRGVFKSVHNCKIVEWCCGCLLLFNDYVFMDTTLSDEMRPIGSFEHRFLTSFPLKINTLQDSETSDSYIFSPKFCRCETLCCIKGYYVIKDEMGHVLFRRRLNSFISCRRVWRCMLCIPFTQLKCSVPYLVTSEWCDECRFPLCQPYTVPVRISTLDDDVSVAKIHQHHDPWCEEQFCCRRPRYNLQCKCDVILFEASLCNLIFSYGPQLCV